MKTTILFSVLTSVVVVVAQGGCSEDCYSDTSLADCSNAAEWTCLCGSETYVDYVNTCIMSECNSTDDRLSAYYTFYEICKMFDVTLGGEEASAASVASTSSISGLPSGIASVSAYTSAILKGPGKSPLTSATSTTPSGSETSAASTLSTMNPGGPMSSASGSSSASGNTEQSATNVSTQPGGPVDTASSSSTATSTQPGGPVESTSSAASSAAATSSSATSTSSASSAFAAPTLRPDHGVALLGVAMCAIAAM